MSELLTAETIEQIIDHFSEHGLAERFGLLLDGRRSHDCAVEVGTGEHPVEFLDTEIGEFASQGKLQV